MDTSVLVRAGRLTTVTVSTALTALLLASCGASSQTADHGESASEDRGAPEAAPDAGAGAEFSGEGAEREAVEAVGPDVEIDDRRLVHTATMTVRVDDVSEAAEAAKKLTLDAEGHVASELVSTPSGSAPRGELTLRVPTDSYEETLVALADLGDRSELERSLEDVTEEVADVESRIESAETALESLRGYLEEAEDVDDLLRVEREIQDRQASLESFQARLESLRDQTAYSTVNLSLRPPSTYLEERPSDESIGFLGGLERGWRALVELGRGLAVVTGWLLPFAVTGAVLGAPPLWWWRRKREIVHGRDRRAPSTKRPRRHHSSTPTARPSTSGLQEPEERVLRPDLDGARADGTDHGGTDSQDTAPDTPESDGRPS